MRTIIAILFCLGLVVLQFLLGGTHPVFAISGLVIIAVGGILSAWPRLKTSPAALRWALISTVPFISYVLVRNRLSPVEYLAREQFLIGLGCLVVYLIFALVLVGHRERIIIYITLSVLGLLQVVVGAIQFKEKNQWMLISWFARTDDWWRASGLFISPNHFAGFLELLAVTSFAAVFWSRFSVFGRVLAGYVGLASLAGIVISGSRGGYLSVAAGLVVLLILSLTALGRLAPKKLLTLGLGAAAALIVGLALAVGLMSSNAFVKDRLDSIADTENVRFQLWDLALKQFGLSPWTGTGGFTYSYYARMFRPENIQNDPIHVHNDYLQLLAEYGLIGVGLFLLFLGVHLLVGFLTTKRVCDALAKDGRITSNQLWWNMSAISSVAVYVVHSAVDFNMHVTSNALLMAMFFGILAGGAQLPEQREAHAGLVSTGGRVLLFLVSAFLLVYCGRLAIPEFHAELARIALRDRNLQDAFQHAEQAITRDPGNPHAHYYAGEAARVLALSSEDVNLAAYYHRKSVKRFEEGLQVFPYDSRAAFKYAHSLSDAAEYVDAMMVLDDVEEMDPNSYLLHAHRGIVELQAGYYEDAIELFEKARQLQAREGGPKKQNDFIEEGIRYAKEGYERELAEIDTLDKQLRSGERIELEIPVDDPEAAPSPTPPLNLRDLDPPKNLPGN